ncbi:nitrate reductase cytochrome c-type subunit [Nitratifractor sp.]
MRKEMKVLLAGAVALSSVLWAGEVIDINKGVDNPALIKKEDLGNKKVVTEEQLGYGAASLTGNTPPPKIEYDRPAPGAAKRFARSYVNAPPLIPHSVKGLLPITAKNNACLGCHMPDVAKSMGATPIPPSHFTDFRPSTKLVNGQVVKEGKVVGKDLKNTTDIKIAKFKKLKKLNPARYNCSQCHVPQANVKPLVGNTFKPDFMSKKQMESSNLLEVIDEGVK